VDAIKWRKILQKETACGGCLDDAKEPEEDARIARAALLEGDLPHAAHHIAAALASDPLRKEWLITLDQIVAEADDPLDLIADRGELWFGDAAVRARFLWLAGRTADALSLLIYATAAAPTVRYLAWGAEWLTDGAAKMTRELAARLARTLPAFGKELLKFPVPIPSSHPVRANVEHALEILRLLDAAHPALPEVLEIRSQMLRRVGKFEEAIEAAKRANELAPSAIGETWLALALRDAGRSDDALAAYRRASERDPANVSLHLDAGDLLLSLERWEEAAVRYQEALRLEPGHAWAEPSLLYAKLRAPRKGLLSRVLGREDSPLELRARLARMIPGNERAAWALDELEPRVPYVNLLPSPSDATVNVLRKVMDARPDLNDSISLTLSALEAPSAALAFQLQLGVKPQITVKNMQQPDPRLPARAVRHLLWKYRDTEPVVNVEPPSPTAVAAVEQLASTHYHLEAWVRGAPPDADVVDLLAVMVHPPPPRAFAPEWIFRIQVAAACLIARTETGWQGTPRREALLDLLSGPLDWTVSAAAIVLGELACKENAARAEITDAFMARLKSAPRPGYCPYLHPMICSWMRIPGVSAAELAELESMRRDLES